MRLKPGLRFGLLVAMLPVLLLPLVGLWFVGQMAELTRTERRQSLDDAARNFAAALHDRSDLLDPNASAQRLPANTVALPEALIFRATIDGRDDEWIAVPSREVPVDVQPGVPDNTLQMTVSVARSQEQEGELFLLVKARDERFLPPLPATADREARPGDQLIVMAGPSPDRLREIPAVMHESADGWLAELTLPGGVRFLRVEAVDVDYQASRRVEATARSPLFALTSPRVPSEGLAQLRAVETQTRWADALRGFEKAGMRVAVYDVSGELLARLGDLEDVTPQQQSLVGGLAARLLSLAVGWSADFNSVDQNRAPLASALTGLPAQTSLRLENKTGHAYWLTTSAHPIWANDQVAGALVLEQTNASDLASGQKALEWLALMAALAIAATVLALLAFSSMTVARIDRLRKAADAAIDARGRVIGTIPQFRWNDEVGSLAHGYERVLDRLREHQQYLANLRGRLVHELRTPIMVVRSSLENLQDDQATADIVPGSTAAFVQRALGGTVRLEKIVSSMSEAANLESMLADSQLEMIDLASLLKGLAQAYESAYPAPGGQTGPRFVVAVAPSLTDSNRKTRAIVPESVAQALDKLVSNAVDYARGGSQIVLELAPAPPGRLQPAGGGFVIAVRNEGPALPAQMQASIFESMVSVRGAGAQDQSHLGLGLYLVRLIAEFHGGAAFAENVSNGVRVGFSVASGEAVQYDPETGSGRVSLRV